MRYILTLLFCASAFGADIGEQSKYGTSIGRWFTDGYVSGRVAHNLKSPLTPAVSSNSPALKFLSSRSGLGLNGTTQFLTVSNSALLSGILERTFAAWVFVDSYGEGGFGRVYSQTDLQSAFYVSSTTNSLRANIGGNPIMSSDNILFSKSWTHIALVRASTTIRFYVNGRFIVARDVGPVAGTSGTIYFGTRGSDRFFHGIFGEMLFFDRQLADAEVAQLYKEGLR
jgi:hypothetical protein